MPTKLIPCYGCKAPTMCEQFINGQSVMACVNCMRFWTSRRKPPQFVPRYFMITIEMPKEP